MKPSRRTFLCLASGAAVLPVISRVARGQAYPMRPVRMIVGFTPGSPPDTVARLMGQWLSERLGQQFLVENRPGAGGNIGTEVVVRAPADGYTLLLVGPPNAINAALYDKLGFDFLRDIAPSRASRANASCWWCTHHFRPKQSPSSSPTPRPTRAKSPWRRRAAELPPTYPASCSR